MKKDDIYATHLKLKNRKVSCVELTQEAVKSAKASTHNAFISLTAESALEEAKAQDQKMGKVGPENILQGIPYTLKDLFITKDVRTTGGSRILYNYVPPYEGYVSGQFKKAGGVLLGKVGCDEFGMGSTNECTPFGPVKNPVDPTKVAGGSSGGSAAAVALDLGLYSMGTDTGGSSRLPANFCGIVGYKPSYGRVSRFGQLAYASSLDQASPMAKSVLDIGCILEHITEKDPRDSSHAPGAGLKLVDKLTAVTPQNLKGKRIGLSQDFIDACDPEVAKNLNQAVELMKKQGAQIVPVSLKNLKYCVSTYYIIATCEASSNLSRYDGIHYGLRANHAEDLAQTYIKSRSQGFGEEVKKRIMLGTFSLSSGYYEAYYTKACKVRRLIADDFQAAFKTCDFVFSPVCSTTAPKIGSSLQDPIKMYMNDLYTIPANLAGLPALAIPFGKDGKGMPTGLQLMGPAFKDQELLETGRAFELALGGAQ